MKKLIAALSISILAAACSTASSSNSDSGSATANAGQTAPAVDIRITGSNLQRETLMQGGNVGATFDFTVTNGTNAPVMLRTVELRSYGSASFGLNTGRLTVHKTVAPNETISVSLRTTASSAGGYLATQEPITIRGEAMFDQSKKSFVRTFTSLIDPR